jgi:hypothetical protein
LAAADAAVSGELPVSIITDILAFLGIVEPASDDFSVAPLVLLKIVDSISLNLQQGDTLTLDQLASKAGAAGVGAAVDTIRAILPDVVFGRAFDSVAPDDVDALVAATAAADSTYEPFRFNNALEIVCAPGYDTSELEDAFNNWTGAVEYAYTGSEAVDPIIGGTGNPLFKFQKYLSAAPVGIDAPAAWAKGADGSGTNFIDLEQGWFLNHMDLPSGITLLQGTNRVPEKKEGIYASRNHGCAVLGMIVGIDDTFGIVGGAPKTSARVLSYYYPKDKITGNRVTRVHDAILAARKVLASGDVLQLEAQFVLEKGDKKGHVPGAEASFMPVEFEPLAYQAIRNATGAGIIVVEAAGNGGKYPNATTKKIDKHGTDLDTYVTKAGLNILGLGPLADDQKSGALMVSGSNSAVPHSRHNELNFGSRIDCYAWGWDIVTSYFEVATPNARDLYWGIGTYTSTPFGRTSGACPIISTSCLLMQHLQTLLMPKGRPAGKLKSSDMIAILTNPANCTRSATPTDGIGVMPDFAKIIANEFKP